MTFWQQLLQTSLIVVVLFTAVEAGAVAPGGPGAVGGETRGVTFFRGTIVCTDCSIAEAQTANPRLGHLYVFDSYHGRVILNMEASDERMWWEDVTGLSNRVWLRGPARMLNSLMAEENLFRQVEIAGLLSKNGVFDVGLVNFLG